MANFEERLASLEQEQATLKHDNQELKQKVELQTMAIGGLVDRGTLQRLDAKYDKIFEALQNHDSLTNTQLAELRDQQTQLDGKIVGVQTEMRQSFEAQGNQLKEQGSKLDRLENMIAQVLARLPEQP